MRQHRNLARIAALLLASTALLASRAEASTFKLWIEGRGDLFSGSSQLFREFDYPVGGGLELGIELIEITFFGEAVMLGLDHFLYTVNLGGDFDFGKEDETRFTVGFFTGPMLFQFPEPDMPSTVDLSDLTPEEQQMIICATVCNCALNVPCNQDIGAVEAHFSTFSQQEAELGRWAFGWNLIRLRLAVDYPLASVLYFGAAAQLGYHLVLSGESVAAGGKNRAVDSYAESHQLDPMLTQKLRDAVGAQPVDTSALDGFNYGLHVYIRLELDPTRKKRKAQNW